MTTPMAQFPQMRDSTESNPDQVEHLKRIELKQQEAVTILDNIRKEQKDYLELRQERWGLIDYKQKSEALMKQSTKLWSAIRPHARVTGSTGPDEGSDFLFALLRPKHSLHLARRALMNWASTNPHHSTILADLVTQLEGNDDVRFEWPEGRVDGGLKDPRWCPVGPGRSIEVANAKSTPCSELLPLRIFHSSKASMRLHNNTVKTSFTLACKGNRRSKKCLLARKLRSWDQRVVFLYH